MVYLQCCLVVTCLVSHETVALLAHVLCTPADNHAPVQNVTLFETTYIGCVRAQLYPATCTFGRMTGSCSMLLQKHRGGTDTQVKFAHHSCNFSIVSLVICHRPSYPHSLEADHSHNKVAHHSNRFPSTSLVLSHSYLCSLETDHSHNKMANHLNRFWKEVTQAFALFFFLLILLLFPVLSCTLFSFMPCATTPKMRGHALHYFVNFAHHELTPPACPHYTHIVNDHECKKLCNGMHNSCIPHNYVHRILECHKLIWNFWSGGWGGVERNVC